MANDELLADCLTEVCTYFGAICGVYMCPYYDVTSTQNRIEMYQYYI